MESVRMRALAVVIAMLLFACSNPADEVEDASDGTATTSVATSESSDSTPVGGLQQPWTTTATATAENKQVAIKEFGFGRGTTQFTDSEVGWAVLIENTSKTQAAESIRLQVTFLDEAGGIVTTETGSLPIILPAQVSAYGGTTYLQDKTKTIQTMKVQALAREWETTDVAESFTTDGVAYQANQFSPKVVGFVTSPFTKDLEQIRVTAVARNAAGNIIGGGFTYLDFVPAGGQSAVEVSVTTSEIPETVELHPELSELTLLGN